LSNKIFETKKTTKNGIIRPAINPPIFDLLELNKAPINPPIITEVIHPEKNMSKYFK
jgi:hypothetical protein